MRNVLRFLLPAAVLLAGLPLCLGWFSQRLGDRAALRPGPDGWRAYGLPYAGSSGIYRNEHAPVAAIVLLGQAKENSIRRVSPAQALCALFPEVSKQGWDPLWTNRVLELLTKLVTQVPVYRLECLPDPSAVDCLKAALQLQ